MPGRIIPVLALLFLFCFPGRSQDTLSRYHFLFASAGYANNYEHPTQNYRTGVAMNLGFQAVRQGKGSWGVEYGVSYYQGWYYSFLIPSTVLSNAYYRRYTETYLNFPLLARKLFLRGSRHYFIAFGPELNIGLVAGQTDVDGNDEALWIFPEKSGYQPSLISAQFSWGCDFSGARGKHFRLAFLFRSGIVPLNINNYGTSTIPFTIGATGSFGFDPDKQQARRERRKAATD